MKHKVSLVVVYNHNYESNIDRIESLYAGRFDKIFHLMPFYRGHKSNVAKIYGNSYLFHDYIRQGLGTYKNNESSHYCFAADDLLLNPNINQYNLTEILNLDDNTGYIPSISALTYRELVCWSEWTIMSLRSMVLSGNGCEYKSFIPDINYARCAFDAHGISSRNIDKNVFIEMQKYFAPDNTNYYKFFPRGYSNSWQRFIYQKLRGWSYTDWLNHRLNSLIKSGAGRPGTGSVNDDFLYPLAYGVSDFLVVPHNKIDDFTNLLGIFAAMNVFVEIAMPTCMLLTLDKLKFEKNKHRQTGNAIFDMTDDMSKQYEYKLSNLMENWPDNLLFIHPLKLSRWS